MTVMSDNSPPFNSEEFHKFLKSHDIDHVTSSPLYPRSNGMVERAVQTVKGLIRKAVTSNISIPEATMEYNSTPKYGLPAPCELIMGRKLRTRLPCTKTALTPKYDISNPLGETRSKSKRGTEHHNHGTRILTELDPHDQVLVQDGVRKWSPAKVIEKCQEPDSYILRRKDGAIVRRNRIHLRPIQQTLVEETKTDEVGQEGNHRNTEDSKVGDSNTARESETLKTLKPSRKDQSVRESVAPRAVKLRAIGQERSST